jgi:hypothetical protein
VLFLGKLDLPLAFCLLNLPLAFYLPDLPFAFYLLDLHIAFYLLDPNYIPLLRNMLAGTEKTIRVTNGIIHGSACLLSKRVYEIQIGNSISIR